MAGDRQQHRVNTSWQGVASWYDGWMGDRGGEYHREVAIPALLTLLDLRPDDRVLDIGAGQGVLAPHVTAAGASYVGVEVSRRMVLLARRRHADHGRFLVGDARCLAALDGVDVASFDAVSFLLSLQDMEPLREVLANAAWALKLGGRLALLLPHPAFQVPRQSGWGWDESRKLRYRRVDRYLTPMAVPMKQYRQGRHRGVLRRFHRPLQTYVNGLIEHGLSIKRIEELPAHRGLAPPAQAVAAERARREIPLFLGVLAMKTTS
jgi:SAM-dependent methyltransferase